MNNNRRMILIAVAATMALGCYTQRPLVQMPPPPSTRIVAQLTDSGTVAMSNAIGAGALAVEGVVSSVDDRQWTLQMINVDHRDGRSIGWNRESVTFPLSALTQTHVKVLDKKKSWLAAGGITLGAFILARSFNLVGASDDGEDGEEPQQIVIPVGGRR